MSEKRLLANRRNAQRSTGPRTPEGKDKSRRNALKHGLAGMGSILPAEDTELFQERMLAWTAEEKPRAQIETYFLTTAALASVRVDRCARNEFAVIAKKRRDTVRNWQRRQDRRIGKLTGLLATKPGNATTEFETFASGCGWLVERWEELQEALVPGGSWSSEQAEQGLRLLGYRPDEPLDQTDAQALEFQAHALVIHANSKAEPAQRQSALTGLRTIVAAEIKRLSNQRAELWYDVEGSQLAESIDLATIDLSHDGALRHRYSVTAHSELHKSFARIAQRHRAATQRERTEARQAEDETPLPDHNALCDWVRQGGQHGKVFATPTGSDPRNATEAPSPSAALSPVEAPAAAPAARLRNEPNETPSSADLSGTCDSAPCVTTAAPGPAYRQSSSVADPHPAPPPPDWGP